MKKKLLFATVLLAVSLIGFVICFRHSQPPKAWREISLGMPRTQVLSHISTEILDQRYAKGFDMTRTQGCHRFGAFGYWMFVTSYDSSDHLSDARIEFVCYDKLRLNAQWPSQLLYRINKCSIYDIN